MSLSPSLVVWYRGTRPISLRVYVYGGTRPSSDNSHYIVWFRVLADEVGSKVHTHLSQLLQMSQLFIFEFLLRLWREEREEWKIRIRAQDHHQKNVWNCLKYNIIPLQKDAQNLTFRMF